MQYTKQQNRFRVFFLLIVLCLGFVSKAEAHDQSSKRFISPCARMFLESGGMAPHLTFVKDQVEKFLGNNVDEVVIIFYALNRTDSQKELELAHKYKVFGDRRLIDLDDHTDPKLVLKNAQAVWVHGGNTFLLLDRLYQYDLIPTLQDFVSQGKPYMGTSAGTAIAAPTIKTSHDWPIVYPPSFDALSLVPFQFSVHFTPGLLYNRKGRRFVRFRAETRERRAEEFHQLHQNTADIIGLPEGSLLLIENNKIIYKSPTDEQAVIFRKGKNSESVAPDTDITDKLID